jgi:hypothetical protein
MEKSAAQETRMQSRFNSTITQFRNQNEVHSNLLQKLILMRDTLSGNLMDVPKEIKDQSPVGNFGIVPQIDDCLAEYSNQLGRFENILDDLKEYI